MTADTETTLSIVVPLAPGEFCWQKLIGDLKRFEVLSPETEVVLVYPESEQTTLREAHVFRDFSRFQWVSSQTTGRAAQLNAGAHYAKGRFLWFLHADTRLDQATVGGLRSVLSGRRPDLFYFRLKFLSDGPALTRINEFGAALRCKLFDMPFGDQGFLIASESFRQIGGYDLLDEPGEDYRFVREAIGKGIPVTNTGARIWTSARKYRERGWIATTVYHVDQTFRRAIPGWWKTCKIKKLRSASPLRRS